MEIFWAIIIGGALCGFADGLITTFFRKEPKVNIIITSLEKEEQEKAIKMVRKILAN